MREVLISNSLLRLHPAFFFCLRLTADVSIPIKRQENSHQALGESFLLREVLYSSPVASDLCLKSERIPHTVMTFNKLAVGTVRCHLFFLLNFHWLLRLWNNVNMRGTAVVLKWVCENVRTKKKIMRLREGKKCIILYCYKLRTFLSGINHKVLQYFIIFHTQILLSICSLIDFKWGCFSYEIHVPVIILNI